MNFPSRVRSLSEVAFSDPAKSIKLRTLVCTLLPPIDCNLGPPGVGGREGIPGVCRPPLVSPRSRLSITTRNTLWLRLLRSFQSVLAVRRPAHPRAITARTAARLVTTSSRSGANHTLAPLPWSCTGGAEEGASRSWIVSLYISRYEQRSKYSRADVRLMKAKTSFIARGMIPGWSSSPDCRHVRIYYKDLKMTVTDQSEGLAAGCLTIGKNDRVVAIHSRAYVITCDGVIYRLVL